jgi:hypothetical protein
MSFFLTDWIKHPSHLPLIGSVFGQTPEQENLTKQIANLQKVYSEYRPQAAAGQMAGLNQRLDAFAPVNQLLGEIQGKGPGAAFLNLDPLRQNPLAAPGAPLAGSSPPAPAGPQLAEDPARSTWFGGGR